MGWQQPVPASTGLYPGQSYTFDLWLGLDREMSPASFYVMAKVWCKTYVSPNYYTWENILVADQQLQVLPADSLMTAVSGPQTGQIGGSIPVNNTIETKGVLWGEIDGGTDSAFYTVDICLFQDDRTIVYRCLGSRNAGYLVDGGTSSDTTSVTIPAGVAPGTYYLGAIDQAWVWDPAVPDNFRVTENNMSNNTLVSMYPIVITNP